jgi:hypothetical protein
LRGVEQEEQSGPGDKGTANKRDGEEGGTRPLLLRSGNVVNQVQQVYNGLRQLITKYQSHSDTGRNWAGSGREATPSPPTDPDVPD